MSRADAFSLGEERDGGGWTEDDSSKFFVSIPAVQFLQWDPKALGEEVLEGAEKLLHLEIANSI